MRKLVAFLLMVATLAAGTTIWAVNDSPSLDDLLPAGVNSGGGRKPAPTKAPVATEAPDATKAPEATEAPDATKAPEATEAPDVTKAPEATEAPVVVTPTEAPVVVTPTEAPVVVTPTEAPVVVVPGQKDPATGTVPFPGAGGTVVFPTYDGQITNIPGAYLGGQYVPSEWTEYTVSEDVDYTVVSPQTGYSEWKVEF